MTKSCNQCQSEIEPQTQRLYTICPCCSHLTEITDQPMSTHNRKSKSTDLRADDIRVSIQDGKFENISTVQQLLKTHKERLSNVENLMGSLDDRLNRLERLIRVSLSWQCPDCYEDLQLTEAGQMYCQQCQTQYPENPTLGDT